MIPFLVVALGSALGGLLRFAITESTLAIDSVLPFGTILINIFGSFLIGFFGTLTLGGSRFAASPNVRLFVMVGICGGFTTFSSFSLQTFDLARGGAFGRALLNVGLSLMLCLAAVALGHHLGQRGSHAYSIAQTQKEEFTG
jgi:CrcB protein